jgi:hypothetical protein
MFLFFFALLSEPATHFFAAIRNRLGMFLRPADILSICLISR